MWIHRNDSTVSTVDDTRGSVVVWWSALLLRAPVLHVQAEAQRSGCLSFLAVFTEVSVIMSGLSVFSFLFLLQQAWKKSRKYQNEECAHTHTHFFMYTDNGPTPDTPTPSPTSNSNHSFPPPIACF